MNGWFCVHRKIIDHWIFSEADLLKLWVYFLAKANHGDKKFMFNGSLVSISRGQFVTGRKVLAGAVGVSENKIRRYLNTLEKESMIHQQITNKYSVITVLNYDQYQAKAPANDSQTLPLTTTNNNVNNITINNTHRGFDFSGWPTMPKTQIVNDWFAMRARIKADVSQTVIDRFGIQMTKAVEKGYTVDDCLAECVTRNWQGFNVKWIENSEVSSGNGKSGNRGNGFSKSDQTRREVEEYLNG